MLFLNLSNVSFQLEPGAMLFPAAFFTPTAAEILQFELGRIKVSLPELSVSRLLPSLIV